MKTRLLLASASALALTWGATAQAENVGIGVLEPQAVLHVRGETADDNDVIFQNMDAYDGTADTENVLLIDEDDGQRVKTIALTDLLTDTTLENSDFSFNTTTNVLSITEGSNTLTVDLSTLKDSLSDTDTTIVSVTYDSGVITITDSASNTFPVNISALDTKVINSALTYNEATNVLSIVEGGQTLTADLSDLQDSVLDTNTTIVSFDYDPTANTLQIVDSDFNDFTVDLSELDDVFTDTTISNTAASLAGTVLTITDETGDVTVDLAALDTDTNTPLATDDQVVTAARTIDLATNNQNLTVQGTATAVTFAADGNLGLNEAAPSQAPDINGNQAFGSNGSIMFDSELGDHGINDIDVGARSVMEVVSLEHLYLTFDSNGSNSGSGVIIRSDAPGNGGTEVARINRMGVGVGVIPDASLHVIGKAGNDNDFIITNLDGYDGLVDDERVMVVDPSDGSRVKTVALGEIITGAVVDETIQNTTASLTGTVLTITDEAGDITVDLAALDTDTDTTVSNTAASLAGTVLTITDETGDVTVDLAALSTDTDTTVSNTAASLAGTVLTITDETGDVTVDLAALDTDTDTTVSNTAASLAGTVLTITDETGDVTVDLAALNTATDTTVSNTAASLTGTVLTITDETGDVTVDLAALDTTVPDTTVSNTAASLAGTVLTITDETGDVTVDLAALDTDTDTTVSNTAASLAGTVLTITDETGDVTVDLAALDTDTDTTVSNTAASLAGTVLTITDETGDVTVDLAALNTATDTTISNTAASLAGTVLTITDETGDVTVDLAALDTDTDTTDLDWALAGTASDLSTALADSIFTNGNVGINTDSPAYPLVVDTGSTQNALVVREGTGDSGPVGRVGIGTDTPGYALDVAGDIRATGNIYSGDQFLASNFFQTSDRRLKTDVSGYGAGLDVLRQMRTVSFRYTGEGLPSNTERVHYGVIAQEMAAIDENLVGSFTSPEDGVEYLSVNVQSMTYVLANAVQQLDAENVSLRAQLAETEDRLARLEALALMMQAQLGLPANQAPDRREGLALPACPLPLSFPSTLPVRPSLKSEPSPSEG